MPVGESALEIVSKDALGFVARVTRSYTVTEESFFLMALVDGASQFLGGHLLDDAKANTSWKLGDSMTIGGRAAVTFKGRIRGSKLAEELFVLAHLDTGKNPEFQPFHAQLVDPSRDYAVFADESGDDHIQARGPLYVLVRADRSKLTLGNVRPDMKGLGLVRYDRALYGALLELDHAFAPGFDTQLKGFVSEDTSRLKRGHDELRATGGSLYYLSRQDILQGSERIQVVIRERDSRLEIERRAKGNLRLKKPSLCLENTAKGQLGNRVAIVYADRLSALLLCIVDFSQHRHNIGKIVACREFFWRDRYRFPEYRGCLFKTCLQISPRAEIVIGLVIFRFDFYCLAKGMFRITCHTAPV